MRMDMPGWSTTYGLYVEGRIRFGQRTQLFVKLDNYLNFSRAHMVMHMNYPRFPGEPPMYAETWPDTYRNVTGLYLRNVHEANPHLKLVIDGRIDYSTTGVTSETGYNQFSIFGHTIDRPYFMLPKSFNLSLKYSFRNRVDLESGMGYAERLPTLSEQFGFYLFNALDGFDYLGNPEINMERSRHLYSHLYFTWPALKINLKNRVSYVKDYILGSIDPELPQMNLYASGLKRFENIPHALVTGSSLELKWQLVHNLVFYSLSSVTYGRTYKGDPLPLIPPFRNLTFGKWQHKRGSFQLESESASTQNRIHPDFGEIATPGYMIFHVRTTLNWNIGNVGMETSTGIENLFDKAYSEHLDWGDYLRPGRNIYVNVRIIL